MANSKQARKRAIQAVLATSTSLHSVLAIAQLSRTFARLFSPATKLLLRLSTSQLSL